MAIPLPAVLIVLDGWGHSERTEGNAIAASRPRFMEWLGRTHPATLLQAAGEAGGVPARGIGHSRGRSGEHHAQLPSRPPSPCRLLPGTKKHCPLSEPHT